MPQRRVFGDAPQFPFYDLRDVLLDLRVIASDDLLHTIHAVGIAERGYFRDRNVRSRLPGELLPVDDDLGVEDFLFDAFVEIVRHGTHEHALREVGDLRGGNQAVELRIGRGGEVVVAQRVGGSQLHDPAEALAQRLGRISQNLTCEDVAHGILDDLGLLLAVVAFELREVLKAQAYGHLVRAGRGDQVVQPPEIDRGQLVDDDRRLEFSFLVDEPRDALGAHAARTPAAQSQKSRSEEFGQVRGGEKPRRTLDVPQQTVRYAERAAVRIEPSVVFIRTNRFIQFLKPTTSVLFRTLC